jgi:hypothetical protein
MELPLSHPHTADTRMGAGTDTEQPPECKRMRLEPSTANRSQDDWVLALPEEVILHGMSRVSNGAHPGVSGSQPHYPSCRLALTDEFSPLPKTDANYTALSLMPTIIGNTFAASLRTDICPQ